MAKILLPSNTAKTWTVEDEVDLKDIAAREPVIAKFLYLMATDAQDLFYDSHKRRDYGLLGGR